MSAFLLISFLGMITESSFLVTVAVTKTSDFLNSTFFMGRFGFAFCRHWSSLGSSFLLASGDWFTTNVAP